MAESHGKNGTACGPRDRLRNAVHHDPREPASATGSHDDQIRIELSGSLHDRLARLAIDEFDLSAHVRPYKELAESLREARVRALRRALRSRSVGSEGRD